MVAAARRSTCRVAPEADQPAAADTGSPTAITLILIKTIAGGRHANGFMENRENTAMNDKQLRQNVIDEFDFEPSIESAEIGVAVGSGTVLHAAWAAPGVRMVDGRLRIS